MERIYELSFEIHADGSIDLEQPNGYDEPERITIHQCQARHIFEKSGHLLPADELSSRLARQMREVHATLANEFGCSRGVDEVITKLTAYIDALPESLTKPAPGEVPEPISPLCQNEQGERPDFTLKSITKE